MTGDGIAELIPVQIIDLLWSTFINEFYSLALKIFRVLKDIREVKIEGFGVLNRQNPFDILPNLEIDMKQIFDVNYVEW